VGWPSRRTWRFNEPLKKNAEALLQAHRGQISFATLGQNIAAFIRQEEQEVYFGQYNSEGVLQEAVEQSIAAVQEPSGQWLRWFVGPHATTVMLFLVVTVVFWRRAEVFENVSPLPEYVHFAPIWARGAALVLDSFIPGFMAYPLVEVVRVVRPMPRIEFFISEAFFEQMLHQTLSAQVMTSWVILLLIYCAVSLIYYICCEYILGATPGKMALRLRVIRLGDQARPIGNVDRNSPFPKEVSYVTPVVGRMTFRQVVIRNVLRFVEYRVVLLAFFLVVLSRRRQRAGDLAARTIVVIKTVELETKLLSDDATGTKEDL
jgi:uncharacterized RDD family membrane protein YckC